ncbi:MAG: hypothetical protein IKC65_05325, partial [Lentisphaeria bacterium]|nr:hypothetical protein [Lentisphaeria bacterium]
MKKEQSYSSIGAEQNINKDSSVGLTHSANTPQLHEGKGGRGAFVRRGTDKYGRVRSQTQPQTTGITQYQNTPLFFESKGGRG